MVRRKAYPKTLLSHKREMEVTLCNAMPVFRYSIATRRDHVRQEIWANYAEVPTFLTTATP